MVESQEQRVGSAVQIKTNREYHESLGKSKSK